MWLSLRKCGLMAVRVLTCRLVPVPSMSVDVSVAMAVFVATAVIAAAAHQSVMRQTAAFALGVPAVMLLGDLVHVACGMRLARRLIGEGWTACRCGYGHCKQQSCDSERNSESVRHLEISVGTGAPELTVVVQLAGPSDLKDARAQPLPDSGGPKRRSELQRTGHCRWWPHGRFQCEGNASRFSGLGGLALNQEHNAAAYFHARINVTVIPAGRGKCLKW